MARRMTDKILEGEVLPPVADLNKFLKEFGVKRFKRGEADCGHMAGAWLQLRYGINPAKQFVEPYGDAKEAFRIIRKAGGTRYLGARLAQQSHLFEVEDPDAGDVGLVRANGRVVFAICVGSGQWALKTERGLVIAPMPHIVAWRRASSLSAEVVGAAILSVVGAASLAGPTAGVSLFGAFVSYSTIVGTIALTAVSLGAQYLLGRNKTNTDPQAGNGAQQEIREAISARIIHYGRVKVGGATIFHDAVDGVYHRWLVTGHSELDAIEEHWLGDTRVDVSPTAPFAVTTAPFVGYANIETRTGASLQSAPAVLLAAYPAAFTADHRANGLSNTVISLKDPGRTFSSVFKGGLPNYRKVARGRKVFDPRTNTTVWSDNLGLVIADSLRDTDQWGLSSDDIDWESFSEYADLCDEDVSLKNGGTEKRYRCWQSVSLADPRKISLGKLLKLGDAEIFTRADGRIGITGGRWEEPLCIITTGMIIARTWDFEPDPTETANELKPIYRSPNHDYQEQEADPWRDEASIISDGLNSDTLDLQGSPSPFQAERLAKIAALRMNSKLRGSLTCTLAAISAYQQRIIRIIDDTLAINQSFLVESFSMNITQSGVSCSLKAVAVGPGHWAWNPATEQGDAPPIPIEITQSNPVPVMTGFTAQSVSASNATTSNVAIEATWNLPTTSSPIAAEIEIEGLETTLANGTALPAFASQLSVIQQGISSFRSSLLASNGQNVRVRGRHTYAERTPGEWTAYITLVSSASTAEPPAITGLSVVGGTGQIVTSWMQPNDPLVASTRVYQNSSNSMTGATLVSTVIGAANQSLGFTITGLAPATYWVLFRTVSSSGTERTTPTSASAVVT